MQVLIAISGFCPRIGNVPCTTPFDFLFVISIHVPTWGTTLSISTNLFALIFQSTFPRGERHHQPGYHYLLHSFQSTFLCGERRHITRMQLTTLHFNPRSRVGNDGWSYSDRICDRDFYIFFSCYFNCIKQFICRTISQFFTVLKHDQFTY